MEGGEGEGALEDVLGCFEEAVTGDFGGEAACAGEGFDDAVGALEGVGRSVLIQNPWDSTTLCRSYHATEQTLEGKPGQSGS